MSRALFFVAILALVAYAIFFRNVKHNVPQPGNVEQKYIRQSGDDSDNSSNGGIDSNNSGTSAGGDNNSGGNGGQ